jgi:phospholipid transport system transporter-binding protein
VLVLPQELTQTEASACLRERLAAMRGEAGNATVVDASALLRFDSAALAVLIELRRESLRLGKSFSVRGLPPRLESLADLYGIAELVPSELTSA